jgi:DNA-binding MarR family transcriptional regulator
MTEVTESMVYDMALRVRLYIASNLADEKRINDLSERETLLLQLVGTAGRMSISEICNFYPRVSNSTISTTITKLWKEKKLVDKNILPENQRTTTVNLTEKGQKVLEEIKKKQSDVFNTVTTSLGLSAEQNESFQLVLKSAIGFFDELLGFELNEPPVLGT